MKRIILLIAFCLSLSVIYAQTIDVVHLKSGFDAKGTITEQTESQITLQTENGKTLTINMSEIDSMEQEEKAFDPRVLIGRWACYKASGERDSRYDMEICEHEGFFTVSYPSYITFHDNTPQISKSNKDIDVENNKVSYSTKQFECRISGSGRKQTKCAEYYECDMDLKYVDDKLKGSIDCTHYCLSIDGTIYQKGPLGKWNIYFVKQ